MSFIRVIRAVTAFVVLLIAAQAVRAQSSPAGATPPDPAFRSFLRVARLTGKPSADLLRIWPATSGAATVPTELQLSAAHRLGVSFAPPSGAETLGPLTVVSYLEQLPDTVRLRARVLELQQQLTALLGPPTQCSLPFGSPSHLYAPQDVARVWTRGISGAPTSLRWEVQKGALPSITVTVGQVPTISTGLFACDAPLP